MTPRGAVRGGPRARARHGHTGRLLGAGARLLGHPRRLTGASWRLMLTGVAWRLSMLGVAHALTRAHHTGAPGSRAHTRMLTWTPGSGPHAGMLTFSATCGHTNNIASNQFAQ